VPIAFCDRDLAAFETESGKARDNEPETDSPGASYPICRDCRERRTARAPRLWICYFSLAGFSGQHNIWLRRNRSGGRSLRPKIQPLSSTSQVPGMDHHKRRLLLPVFFH
jgi:hypothetical protein